MGSAPLRGIWTGTQNSNILEPSNLQKKEEEDKHIVSFWSYAVKADKTSIILYNISL